MNNPPPLIPRSVLFGNPERSLPKIAPNGKTLAYLAPLDGVMNVYLRSAVPPAETGQGGVTDERPITASAKRGIGSYVWQPDSQHILYIQDQGGDENWRVYQTNIETRETRDLTPFENVQARILNIDPRFPDVALLTLNQRDARIHDVYRVDLMTGALTLIVENTENFAGYRVDNQMRVRAAQKMLPDGSTEIYVRDDEPSAWRFLLSWSADETGGIAAFSPDDSKLWITTSQDANASRLMEVETENGLQRVLAEDAQYDVSGVMINPLDRRLEAVAFVRARTEWLPLDNTAQADLEELLQVRNGDITVLSRDDSDSLWTVAYVIDDGPTYYYLYNRAKRVASELFSNRPSLAVYALAKMTPIEFTARDGMNLYGYVSLPPNTPPQNLPMVLFVHGGPWARDMWGYSSYV